MQSAAELTVEVHTTESWMDLAWQQNALHPLRVGPAVYSEKTDAFLFFEEAITQPERYMRVPWQKRFGLITEVSTYRVFPALALSHVDHFRTIFTHDPLLLSVHPVFKRNLYGTSWVFKESDFAGPLPQKTKTISLISSNLSILPGHKLRLELCRRIHESGLAVDLFGRDNPWGPYLPDRRDGVAPYLFNVAVENCQRENYFTEKLIDCLVTRTVPLYWGCPNISAYFNSEGMLFAHSADEMLERIQEILKDPAGQYERLRPAMEENFRRAMEVGNVRHPFGSVAREIEIELSRPVRREPRSWRTRLKHYWIQLRFLAREHGARKTVKLILPRGVRGWK